MSTEVEFAILPPVDTRWTEGKLLGLDFAERARRMLLNAGAKEASSVEGDCPLLLYPAELVGPAKLGKILAERCKSATGSVAFVPEYPGRSPLFLDASTRRDLVEGAQDLLGLYSKAMSLATQTKIPYAAVPVTSAHLRRKAKWLLLSSLRKKTDGLVSRTLNRPVSIAISALLSNTPVTPNVLSFLTFAVALLSAAMMATGRFMLGGILLHASSVLDGCDGEVARLKYQTSKAGAWLDVVLDDLSTVIFALCLGIGLYVQMGGVTGKALLAVCVSGVLMSVPGYLTTYSRSSLSGALDTGRLDWSRSPNPSPLRQFLVTYLQPAVKRDGYYFLFMLLALAGIPWLIVVLYTVGAMLTSWTVLTDRSAPTEQVRPTTVEVRLQKTR